jgi:hypothetical protein
MSDTIRPNLDEAGTEKPLGYARQASLGQGEWKKPKSGAKFVKPKFLSPSKSTTGIKLNEVSKHMRAGYATYEAGDFDGARKHFRSAASLAGGHAAFTKLAKEQKWDPPKTECSKRMKDDEERGQISNLGIGMSNLATSPNTARFSPWSKTKQLAQNQADALAAIFGNSTTAGLSQRAYDDIIASHEKRYGKK